MVVHAVLAVLALVEVGIIAFWLSQHVAMNRIARDRLRVPLLVSPHPAPPITVIIPARNEAAHISDCMESVLNQEYPALQVIIADDRSTDGTGELAQRAAAGDPRVKIQRIDELPMEWLGKSHALWQAAQRADTPWLLFMDADCRLLQGGLGAALGYAINRDLDFLTLWPRDGSTGFWERLIIPLCGAMIVLWYGRRSVNDPNAVDAFANGQFLLIRRDAYLSFGGHSAVRNAIIEDIPLARAAKAAGVRILSALGVDVYSVRMYATLGEIVRGWRRIYVGVLSRRRIALCMISILIGSLAPYGLISVMLPTVLLGTGGWALAWLILAIAHLIALMATSVRFFSLARCKIRYLWLYPVSCIGVLLILGMAFAKTLGRTELQWRGTTYSLEGSTIRSHANTNNSTGA